MTTPKYVIWDTSGVKFICPVSCPGPTLMVILQILARMLPITVILQDLAKNVKDQVCIKQRYLTQVNKKHDNLENVLIYCQKKLILLFIGAVRCVSRFANRSFLLLCGDIEKNPGPFDASKLSTLDDAIFGAQNGIKFLLFNARSILNKYQDISNLLQQLDSETIVRVTETWMSEEQSLNINLVAEHNFLHKNRSHQTGAAKGGGVGIWIPKNINFKRRREFELADPKFFETLWLELGNPLTEKCLINISYCPHQSLGDFFLDELSAEVYNAFSATDNILLFGDYNIDMLSVNGKRSLQNFSAGLGLQLSNIDIPTRISNNKKSLIDQCVSTNEQITSWKVCLPPFDIDHNVFFLQSKHILLEEKQIYFIKRDTKKFLDETFNRDLTLADWRTVYQQRNCDENFA